MQSIICGNASALPLDSETVQCVVTSPPYWGLRNYGVDDQLGLERTPEEYVAKMVEVFREVRRVLRKDGTLWLNIGDSYNASPGQRTEHDKAGWKQVSNRGSCETASRSTPTLKPKDLVGIPWMLAFALRADGWWLRQDIIWAKRNPMPESVVDRCTKAHEYLFLLTKNAKYFYDHSAVMEPAVYGEQHARKATSWGTNRKHPNKANVEEYAFVGDNHTCHKKDGRFFRNRRSVWEMSSQPYKGAHFATFPEKLVEPCILAGSKEDSLVLDPFCGSGTVGAVCKRLQRRFIGIELNPAYCELARQRIGVQEEAIAAAHV